MLKATAGLLLPTTIIGSLPRPSWYTENLGTRVVPRRHGRHRASATSTPTRCPSTCASRSSPGSTSSPTATAASTTTSAARAGRATRPAHGGLRPRLHPRARQSRRRRPRVPARPHPARLSRGPGHAEIVGPDRPRRAAVRGAVEGRAAADDAAGEVRHRHARSWSRSPSRTRTTRTCRARIMAISDALNEELHDLADAGCPVIQMEEPQIHLLAARGIVDDVITPEFMLEVFNNTVKGLRDKTEVWCHTCWGNPSQQRMFATGPVLRAGARVPEPGRRGRDHLRDVQLRRRRISARSARDHRQAHRRSA